MLIIPAIDILEGKCVRLVEGNFAKKTIYGNDPVAMAQHWEAEGAEYLHIVDLDGARAGTPQNLAIVEKIVRKVKVPIQVGGGIRSMETIDKIIRLGASRIILGTAAVNNPMLIEKACHKYREHIVVGIDSRNGIVAVNGWQKMGNIEDLKLAVKMKEAGVKRIIYTDITLDGKLSGINLEATKILTQKLDIHLLVSGGVRNNNDIIAASKWPKIEGIVVGKALYTGGVILKDAINAVGRVRT